MIFDYNSDYLPPTGSLIPYVHDQNAAMERFADLLPALGLSSLENQEIQS